MVRAVQVFISLGVLRNESAILSLEFFDIIPGEEESQGFHVDK